MHDVDNIRHLGIWCRCFVREWVPILNGRLGCGMPGVVNGVRGQFISATETIIRINGFNVEGEEFSFPASDNKG